MTEKNSNKLKILSIVLLSIGLLLIGFAITANIILSSYTQSVYCKSDITCPTGKICCELSGMCSEPEVCNDLKNNLKDFSKEIPIKKDYSQYMNLGIAISILAIVLLIIVYSIEKKEKRKK